MCLSIWSGILANTINPRSDSVGGNPKSFFAKKTRSIYEKHKDSKQLRLLQKKLSDTNTTDPSSSWKPSQIIKINLICLCLCLGVIWHAYPCIYPPCNLDISSKLHFLLFFALLHTTVSVPECYEYPKTLATGTPRSTMKGSSSVASPAGFKPRTYLEGSAFHCWEMFSDAKRIQNCRVVKFESQVCFSEVEGLKWFKQLVEICSVHISNE